MPKVLPRNSKTKKTHTYPSLARALLYVCVFVCLCATVRVSEIDF